MKRFKHNFKKGMAFVLSLAMVAGLVPAMSGGANTVQAATGSGTEPSVTAYATNDQLMNAFKPNSDGTATTTGKLVFGHNSDGNAQEWYILGADSGVTEGNNNTIIFAASPIAKYKVFNSSTGNNANTSSWSDCNYGGGSVTEVYANHYGASELRDTLQTIAADTSYFTSAEQGLMNDTTVTTNDMKNSTNYTTTDKLYALAADSYGSASIKAGSGNSTVLALSCFCGYRFWLRSPDVYSVRGLRALLVSPGDAVDGYGYHLDYRLPVQPASNLDLSSVLFASAATAASSDTKSEKITDGTAMTLRLDGTYKNIGTVTYNITTGDIKAVKGSTSQTVALVVQGNDGTNDWYYSKKIDTSETINISAIEAESYTPASIDLSTCKIWLEITEDNVTYAVNATETVVSDISSVAITDMETPVSNTALDTEASCVTEGVSSTTPQITWTPSDTTAGYNTSYTASITLTAATGYEFTDSTTATVNGNTATSVTKNADGTLTVTYDFPATAKDKLISITTPQPITVANGTAYDAMNLPATVNIVTEGNTVSSAQATWDTTTPASGSYEPSVLTEQTVTLTGTVTCPDSIDDNGVTLTTTITITISAAGIVGAPTANPTAGTYTENQSVTLTSSTEEATIYYTTDGSNPTITGGVPGGTTKEYTAPIAVTGTEGQSITTTIKAIAVKNGMQDSSVGTFTYTIQIPVTEYTITATAGANGSITPSGAVRVAEGGSQTFTITPAMGYEIDTLKVDGSAVSSATSYTFSNVDKAHTIEATFKKTQSPTPTPTSYKIISGADSEWKQNTDETITIRGNGEFSKFESVKVDGSIIDAQNYTAKEGSTIITLKADYLKTLSVGTHSFEIVWTDGSAVTSFKVSKNTSDNDGGKDNNNNKDNSNNSNNINDNPNSNPAAVPDDKKTNGSDSGNNADDSQQITAPQTGDNSHPMLWVTLLAASLAGLLALLSVRRKKDEE